MAIKRPKYGNKKIVADGVTWDSKREYQRWLVLKDAQGRGEISNLERQPKFVLQPKLTEQVVEHLKTKDRIKEKTVLLPITYTADFAYDKNGKRVVEDVKISPKMLPPEFVLKIKMMRYVHGVEVRLVYKATEAI